MRRVKSLWDNKVMNINSIRKWSLQVRSVVIIAGLFLCSIYDPGCSFHAIGQNQQRRGRGWDSCPKSVERVILAN